MQFLLQMEQFFSLTLHHTGHRNACPAADHFRDIIGSHLLTNQRITVLGVCQLLLDGLDIIFECLEL